MENHFFSHDFEKSSGFHCRWVQRSELAIKIYCTREFKRLYDSPRSVFLFTILSSNEARLIAAIYTRMNISRVHERRVYPANESGGEALSRGSKILETRRNVRIFLETILTISRKDLMIFRPKIEIF